MKKILIVLLALITLFTLTACGKKEIEEPKKENNETSQKENIDINNGEENNKQEENNQNNNVYNNDDEIIEYDDAENTPPEEPVVVEKIINCDGCVFAYLDGSTQTKYLGSTITESEYTTDINNLRTKGGKQRRNFFGFVLSGNVISKAYSCIYKDNKIYCIQGSTDGAYFSNNIGVLNEIFASSQCKYLSDGYNYWCTDNSYNGNTKKSGYTALHYDTSCTIYGSDARAGELVCH